MTCLSRTPGAKTKPSPAFLPGEKMMRKLWILSVLVLLTVGTTGCFHNICGPGMGGLFAARRPQQTAVQCCRPYCPPPCCDPCATTTVTQMMPTVPCCQ